MISGFGAVHWKGTAFVAVMMAVELVGVVLAVVTERAHPIVAVSGVLIALGSLIVGNLVCARHTESDS